ncbi:hypothetical protein [Ruegeria jejuensis]|uniref:hypothetical protein n=1 Tax=Ruegeria jejuensis TaxID=3233338 RepID=UPI00355BA6EA
MHPIYIPYITFFSLTTIALYALHHDGTDLLSGVLDFLTWLLVFGLACLFIFAFTQRLGDTIEPEPDPNEVVKNGNKNSANIRFDRLILLIRASYFFMILTIGVCIVPFVAPEVMIGKPGASNDQNGPFLVVVGCVEGKSEQLTTSCANSSATPQWLVGLGASKSQLIWANTPNTVTTMKEQFGVLATEIASLPQVGEADGNETQLREKAAEIRNLTDRLNSSFANFQLEAQQFSAVQGAIEEVNKAISSVLNVATAFPDEPGAAGEGNGDAQLINAAQNINVRIPAANEALDGLVQQIGQNQKGTRLVGGLVVPLFVIVLSLLGGSISMTRKLPEIQLRAAPGYESFYRTKVQGKVANRLSVPIKPEQARDFLIFQILQVMTAPFLAMVVFASFEPESTAAAVIIGFGAGFASEPLLLKLRQAIDHFAGLTPKQDAQTEEALISEETNTEQESDDTKTTPNEDAAVAINAGRQSLANKPANTQNPNSAD